MRHYSAGLVSNPPLQFVSFLFLCIFLCLFLCLFLCTFLILSSYFILSFIFVHTYPSPFPAALHSFLFLSPHPLQSFCPPHHPSPTSSPSITLHPPNLSLSPFTHLLPLLPSPLPSSPSLSWPSGEASLLQELGLANDNLRWRLQQRSRALTASQGPRYLYPLHLFLFPLFFPLFTCIFFKFPHHVVCMTL